MSVLGLVTGAASPGARSEEGAARMLFTNATIWTGDPAHPWGEALLVEGGRVVAVGSGRDLAPEAASARIVDLGGAFVLPGLVDAHAHVLGLGIGMDRIDLTGAASLSETVERVRRGVVSRREEGFTGWVRGRGWDQNDWPVTAFPTRNDLDPVSENYPVVLTRVDGHALWVNSRALALAGITRETPDPHGGKILRDRGGEPTGILVDDAMELLTVAIPETDRETKRRAIERATQACARAGLTEVHDMGMSAEEVGIYRDLAREGKLAVRIYGAIAADDPRVTEVLAGGPDRDWVGGTFRLGMVKFYVDGALGSRGAALEEPYSDDPGNTGLLRLEPDSLRAQMTRALAAGFQCAVHAIGDRANREVLDAWEAIRATGDLSPRDVPPPPLSLIGEVPARIPPVRLEHAQILRPADVPRVGALGVIASMQPTHCTSDMPWAPARLGKDRLRGAYAWRSIVDGGAVLAAGSDFPVESHDPRLGLYAAVTRRAPDGTPPGGWSPEERLTREEALAAFTAAPAYAAGDLHRLGTLTPGKFEDLTVFDRDLATCDPESLLGARPLLTVVGGKVTWIDPEAPFAGALGASPRR